MAFFVLVIFQKKRASNQRLLLGECHFGKINSYICTSKIFQMLGFKSLVVCVLGALALLSNHGQVPATHVLPSGNEATISTNDHKGVATIEFSSFQYQVFDTSQNSKLPFSGFFETKSQPTAHVHQPVLLYYSIGNAIDLSFTSTSMIFPFHCFT